MQKNALGIAEKFEYVLAIELLSAYQAQQFVDPSHYKRRGDKSCTGSHETTWFQVMEEDIYCILIWRSSETGSMTADS